MVESEPEIFEEKVEIEDKLALYRLMERLRRHAQVIGESDEGIIVAYETPRQRINARVTLKNVVGSYISRKLSLSDFEQWFTQKLTDTLVQPKGFFWLTVLRYIEVYGPVSYATLMTKLREKIGNVKNKSLKTVLWTLKKLKLIEENKKSYKITPKGLKTVNECLRRLADKIEDILNL